MASLTRKSIVMLPTIVSMPNVLGKDISTREQVIINTFKELNKAQNDGYNDAVDLMTGGGTNMRVGTGTIPQATSNSYSFNPGFNLPQTSIVPDFGGDFYHWDYHIQTGLLEDANGFNFVGHGRVQFVNTGDPVPNFEIELDFNTGVATVSAWDFCWLVIH